MSPFQKNLQKFLVIFFTAVSIVLVVMGIARSKKSSDLANATAPDQTGQATAPAPTVDTTSAIAFSGASYQTPWGNASAAIKVKNGRVVAVTMPQVPNSPPSQYAEQYLVNQALSAGSANIQGVSGATYTSLAFKSSLESALAKAKSQGQTIVGGTNATTPASKPAVPRKHLNDDEESEVKFEDWFR